MSLSKSSHFRAGAVLQSFTQCENLGPPKRYLNSLPGLRYTLDSSMAKVEGEEVEYIQLLKDEGGGLLYEEGIATISFYKGDFKKAVDALRIQFRAVITANPWLAGQLVTRDGKVTIRHSSIPSVEEIDKLFTSTSADDTAAFKLSSTSTYVKTCNDMYNSQKVIVAAGSSLLDQNKPLCILTLSESKPGEFALIFSIIMIYK